MINTPIYHSTNTQKSANQCDAESIGKPRYDGTTGCPRKTSGKEKTSCKSLRRWFSSECFFTSKTHFRIFIFSWSDLLILVLSSRLGCKAQTVLGRGPEIRRRTPQSLVGENWPSSDSNTSPMDWIIHGLFDIHANGAGGGCDFVGEPP